MSWTEADLRQYVDALYELKRIEQKLVDGGLIFDHETVTCDPESGFDSFAAGRVQRLRTLYEPLNYEKFPDVFYSDGTLKMVRDDMDATPLGWYYHIGRNSSGGPYKTEREAREAHAKSLEFNQRHNL